MKRSGAYAWYVLGLLTAINFVNYVDRMVPNGMYGDLRRVFGLSDGQIGALAASFFAVHAVTTIPFGWAADRWDRRKILGLGVIAWSLATLGSAYAVGFASLLLFRACIGVGEAAYGPVSNALLCDMFPPEKKARTIAIFNVGMFAGATIGGAVGAKLGFPKAFLLVAFPGLVLGALTFFLRVPPLRTESAAAPRPSIRSVFVDSLRSVNVPTLRWMLVSGVLISFAAGGYITWFIDFITRYKHLTVERAAEICGLIALTGGPAGVLAGGLLADRLQRWRSNGRTLAIAIGFFLSVPFSWAAIFLPRDALWYVTAWLLMFFIPFYNGPMAAVIDDVVDDHQASTAQATFSFVLHLVGTGPGGVLVGVVSDVWDLQHAMLLPIGATGLAGVFCLVASRHVARDMDARALRAARTVSRAPSVAPAAPVAS